MEPNETDIELIDNYLLDALDEESKKLVEQRLTSDDSFRQLFEQMEVLVTGIQMSGKNEIKEGLKILEKEIRANKAQGSADDNIISINRNTKNSNRKLWAPLSIAASIMILIGLVYFNNPFGAKTDQLASLYEPISPDIIYNSVRSNEVGFDELKAKISNLLFDKDYDEAIIFMDQVIEQGDDSSENVIRVYGNTILQIKNCNTGNDKLNTLKSSVTSEALKGIIAIDEALLLRKCRSEKSVITKKIEGINSLNLLEYDQQRLQELKSSLSARK